MTFGAAQPRAARATAAGGSDTLRRQVASSSGPAESGAVLRSPEEPPGLDRVRRFLARPLAAARFVWLWARWIGIHLGRGLAVVGRSAYRGARVAQAAGAVADSVGKVGNRLDGMGQNWSRAGGRLGRVGGRLASAGRRMRSGGSRWADTARGAAGVGVALGELHEAITGEAPEGEKPVVREPVAAPVPEALPEPGAKVEAKAGAARRPERAERASRTPTPSRPGAGAPKTPSEQPDRGEPAERGPARDSPPVARRSRRRSRRASRSEPASAPVSRPAPVTPDRVASEPGRPTGGRSDSGGAIPAAAAAPPPAGPTAPDSDASAGKPPAPGTEPADKPGGDPATAGSDSPAASAAAGLRPESRLSSKRSAGPDAGPGTVAATVPAAEPSSFPDLPAHWPADLRAAIRDLGERPRSEELRRVIAGICAEGWITDGELAGWLDRDERNLRKRHLLPMMEAGLIESRYPIGARRTDQAYRVPPAAGG